MADEAIEEDEFAEEQVDAGDQAINDETIANEVQDEDEEAKQIREDIMAGMEANR